jgi:hypothetical protein
MNEHERQSIELRCARVVLDFFERLDKRCHDDVSLMMARNGVWHRNGDRLVGRSMVLAALEQRPLNRATAHIVTNLRVDVLDETSAAARFLLTAYECALDATASDQGARLAGIRECTDRLRYEEGAWRIAEKSSEPCFPTAPLHKPA